MTGKEKCKYLKTLRADIAKAYNIKGFEYKECPFTDDCTGTCPACDAEAEELYEKLKALNKNLEINILKQQAGAVKNVSFLKPQDDMMGDIGEPTPEFFEEAGVMAIDDDPHWKRENPPISPNRERLMGKIVQVKDKPPINQRDGRLKGAIRQPQDQTQFDDVKNKPRGLRGLFKKKK